MAAEFKIEAKSSFSFKIKIFYFSIFFFLYFFSLLTKKRYFIELKKSKIQNSGLIQNGRNFVLFFKETY
jgi:hypothetical protein